MDKAKQKELLEILSKSSKRLGIGRICAKLNMKQGEVLQGIEELLLSNKLPESMYWKIPEPPWRKQASWGKA